MSLWTRIVDWFCFLSKWLFLFNDLCHCFSLDCCMDPTTFYLECCEVCFNITAWQAYGMLAYCEKILIAGATPAEFALNHLNSKK